MIVGGSVIVVEGTFVLSVAAVEPVDAKVEVDCSTVEEGIDVLKVVVVVVVVVVVDGAKYVVGLGVTKSVESFTVVGRFSVVVVDCKVDVKTAVFAGCVMVGIFVLGGSVVV